MDFEPINIYSHRIAPAAVVEVLRRHYSDVNVTGPDDAWTKLTAVIHPGGFFRRPKLLHLTHKEEYYDGEDWPRQRMGLQNFVCSWNNADEQPDLPRLIRSFRFCLAVPTAGLDPYGKDPRIEALLQICRELDGILFTPSCLRDSAGRTLIDASGQIDPQACLPRLPPVEDHPDAEADFDHDDEDDEEPEPPTPERVARRLLALTAVAARATVELDHSQGVEDLEDIPARIAEWVNELGISDELEPQEWKVIQRPVGGLEQSDFINAMWRVEGAAVLAYALKLHDLPAYDELIVPPELYDSVGLLNVELGAELLAHPDLCDEDELQGLQEHLLALHWRVRDFSLRPEAMDFVAFSRDCWFGSFDLTNFRVLNGDLAIGDVPIAEAEPEDVSRVNSIAMERHLAINWLHGYSRIYSETDTST